MNVRHNILSRFLGVLTVMVFALLGITSCSETETTDKTDFILYYTSMTDIGPGMSSDIAQPSYKGATPSDFTITGVTLDGQAYTGNLFEINPTSGTVHIESDETTPVGVYKISVSCVAGGSTFTYNDIISVNFLKRVPEGITVTPEALVADFADIIDANSTVELPTAQVTTEQNHISITGYSISSVRLGETIVDNKKNPMFAVSSDGTISIVRGSNAIEPGLYTIDLKLNTAVSGSDSEEGLFANALTVNVTSKPLALTYATGKLEEATEESGNTSFVSQVPTFKGSTDGIAYSIESVSPASDKFVIDAKTGVISVAEGHGLKSGEKYVVSVRVKNDYSTEGVVFNNVFTLNVVEYIEPISNFAYEMTPVTEQVEFEIPVKDGFKGAEPVFVFESISAEDKNIVSLDGKTGTISAKKGHKLTLGEHKFTVKASNDKNSETAELIINVTENPNKFTYIRYGNNLGLTPAENYANQFRLADKEEFNGNAEFSTPETDSKKTLTWSVSGIDVGGTSTWNKVKIDSKTGKLTLNALPNEQKCVVVLVKATAGSGKKAYSITVPVFFHNSNADKTNGKIEYTPFVLQVNPKKGGRSVTPTITNTIDMSKFVLDFRRDPIYYNINGEYQDGTPLESGGTQKHTKGYYKQSPFMEALWVQCGAGLGAKAPMAYFDVKGNIRENHTDKTLGYVDNADGDKKFSVVINANQWCQRAEDSQDILAWANGVVIMSMTYSDNVTNVNKGTEVGPIVIWLDTNF
ncbi:putative uncharacterized protein [Bacteroides sp. CAG:530]|nr:putative uncharacterized protein [Bacteroides sp. CAG:530]